MKLEIIFEDQKVSESNIICLSAGSKYGPVFKSDDGQYLFCDLNTGDTHKVPELSGLRCLFHGCALFEVPPSDFKNFCSRAPHVGTVIPNPADVIHLRDVEYTGSTVIAGYVRDRIVQLRPSKYVERCRIDQFPFEEWGLCVVVGRGTGSSNGYTCSPKRCTTYGANWKEFLHRSYVIHRDQLRLFYFADEAAYRQWLKEELIKGTDDVT